jgi:hypothetical protein
MNHTSLLGTILDTFTMNDGADRVIIIDNDCSKDVNYGDYIEVVSITGECVKVILQDGFTDDASKYGIIKSEKVSSLRIKNLDFPEKVNFKGGRVCRIRTP